MEFVNLRILSLGIDFSTHPKEGKPFSATVKHPIQQTRRSIINCYLRLKLLSRVSCSIGDFWSTTSQFLHLSALTHYRPAMPFGNRKKNSLKDLFKSVFSQFKRYHPSGKWKFNNLSIFQSLKFRNLTGKSLRLSLKLNFTLILWAVISKDVWSLLSSPVSKLSKLTADVARYGWLKFWTRLPEWFLNFEELQFANFTRCHRWTLTYEYQFSSFCGKK